MHSRKQHCPRCNALQNFGDKYRNITHEIRQIYIECSYCHWEEVIMEGTSDMITLHRKIERLRIRAERDPRARQTLERYRELFLDKKRSYEATK